MLSVLVDYPSVAGPGASTAWSDSSSPPSACVHAAEKQPLAPVASDLDLDLDLVRQLAADAEEPLNTGSSALTRCRPRVEDRRAHALR